MVRKIFKWVGIVLLVVLLYFAFRVWQNWDTVQRVFLGGVKGNGNHRQSLSFCQGRL